MLKLTAFILNILTILILKFNKFILLPLGLSKILARNWQMMPCSAASAMGLHCLFRPVCPNILGRYSTLQNINTTVNVYMFFISFKGSIFLKNRNFIIQERFNKLIYGINAIIKCDTWHPVKFQLVSRSWNEMIFYHISELMLPTLIQRYDKKSFRFWFC